MAIRGKNMGDVKQSNRYAILQLLHQEGGMSRKQLAARLNLTPAAITLIVNDMIADRIVREGDVLSKQGSAGRREILVEISNDVYAAGLSINIDNVLVSVTDPAGHLVAAHSDALPQGGAEAVLKELAGRVLDVLHSARIAQERVIGLGVAVRGTVDPELGVSQNSYGIWEETNVPVRALLGALLPFPVSVDNNVRSLANAEQFLSQYASIESMLFVRCEYGIGAAITLEHHAYAGYQNRSAELGHIHVAGQKLLCRCGQRGCLETIASGNAMLTRARAVFSAKETPVLYALAGGSAENVTLDSLLDAARRGDAGAGRVVELGISSFAQVLCASGKLLDVQTIVLYGRIFQNAFYTERLRAEMMAIDARVAEQTTVSRMNLELDALAAPVQAVRAYFRCGGKAAEAAEN